MMRLIILYMYTLCLLINPILMQAKQRLSDKFKYFFNDSTMYVRKKKEFEVDRYGNTQLLNLVSYNKEKNARTRVQKLCRYGNLVRAQNYNGDNIFHKIVRYHSEEDQVSWIKFFLDEAIIVPDEKFLKEHENAIKPAELFILRALKENRLTELYTPLEEVKEGVCDWLAEYKYSVIAELISQQRRKRVHVHPYSMKILFIEREKYPFELAEGAVKQLLDISEYPKDTLSSSIKLAKHDAKKQQLKEYFQQYFDALIQAKQ